MGVGPAHGYAPPSALTPHSQKNWAKFGHLNFHRFGPNVHVIVHDAPKVKEGVLKAVGDIAERVRRGRKVRGGLWFSIAKGGDKTLDHIGKGIENNRRTLNLRHVLRFCWSTTCTREGGLAVLKSSKKKRKQKVKTKTKVHGMQEENQRLIQTQRL